MADFLADAIVSDAAAVQPEKKDALKIIGQLGYSGITGDKIILTDSEILTHILPQLAAISAMNRNCTTAQKRSVTSSAVLFASGHGNDLDVSTRPKIVEAILGLEFKFPELGADGSYKLFASGRQKGEKKVKKSSYLNILVPYVYKTEADFRRAFVSYIEKSVYVQMAMGQPGPSAPMSLAEEPSEWVKQFSACSANQEVCLQGFSSSEIDIFVVENAYALLQQYLSTPPIKPPLKNCEMIEFNRVIRHILRANFIDIWAESIGEQKGGDMWKRHYLKLLQETISKPSNPEIWVLKRLNKFSYDRYYQLKPNDGEEPEYRVHEGLHIFDFRDPGGIEVKVPGNGTIVDFTSWKNTLIKEGPEKSNTKLDTNNLKNPAFRTKFFEYVKGRFPTAGVAPSEIEKSPEQAIRTAIAGILYSIENAELYLSEICLLGFLLGIQMLTLYDPACRPLTHSVFDDKGNEIVSTTRSGLVRPTDEIEVGKMRDSLITQLSQPID